MYFTSIAINIYMGIKITELTSASTLVGNELTPLIQSTETRQTAVSSVFTALTSQNDGRYVTSICAGNQGCITFTGAGNGNLNLGVGVCSSVEFSGLTANDDSLVVGDLVIASPSKLCSRGDFCSLSGVQLNGTLQANGNTILGNCSSDTLIIKGSSITLDNCLPAGVDNSVVVLDSDKTLRTDEIDNKVWGGKLVDYCGTVGNNKIPRFIGTTGTVQDSIITDSCSIVSIAGSLVVDGTGGCAGGGGTTTIKNNVNISGSKSLAVTGCLTVSGGGLILNCLPTSDPLVSGGVYYCACDRILRISCCT